MDAGVCVACQTLLGEVDLEGVLGLFPRVRCPACGLVNVLSAGTIAAVATPQLPRGGMETSAAIDVSAYQDLPAYEDPSGLSLDAEPAEYSEDAGYAPEPSYGSEESAYGAEEPAYASEEPAYASEEPAYGAEEPSYGSEESAYSAEEGEIPASDEEDTGFAGESTRIGIDIPDGGEEEDR